MRRRPDACQVVVDCRQRAIGGLEHVVRLEVAVHHHSAPRRLGGWIEGFAEHHLLVHARLNHEAQRPLRRRVGNVPHPHHNLARVHTREGQVPEGRVGRRPPDQPAERRVSRHYCLPDRRPPVCWNRMEASEQLGELRTRSGLVVKMEEVFHHRRACCRLHIEVRPGHEQRRRDAGLPQRGGRELHAQLRVWVRVEERIALHLDKRDEVSALAEQE
mmetsp:Transcript_23855/g.76912  ORF Transcript_23855/g.76912 Transcript_23855/m.76912 type:complete len:216 (+) Transcript_23855:610-1257(+)